MFISNSFERYGGLVAMAMAFLATFLVLGIAVSADAEVYTEDVETDTWGYYPDTFTLWMDADACPEIEGNLVTDVYLFGDGDFGFLVGNTDLMGTVEYVEFMEGTVNVPSGLFSGYRALEWLVFSDDVEHIGAHIVSDCIYIKGIVFGAGLETVEDYAFEGVTFSRLSNLVPMAHHPDELRDKTFTTVKWGSVGTLYYNDLDRASGNGWRLNEGTLYISYFDRDRYSFTKDAEDSSVVTTAPWGAYKYGISKVVIGPGITTVPNYAFFGMSLVTKVDLGDAEYIKNAAFSNCVALEDVNLNKVKAIESYAFYQCCSLRAIELTFGLSILPSHSFYGCTSLEEVTLVQVATIGQYAFTDRYGQGVVTQITFSECLSTMSPSAFGRATFLLCDGTTAESPSDLAGRTFCRMTGTTYIESEKCGENTFWHISDDGVLTITGDGATWDFQATKTPWYSARKSIETVVVCEGVTYVGDKAFYKYPNLRYVFISDSVEGLGDYAFRGEFDKVVVGTGLTSTGVRSLCIPGAIHIMVGPGSDASGGAVMPEYRTVKCTASNIRGQTFVGDDGDLVSVRVSGAVGGAVWSIDREGTLTVTGSGAIVFGKASDYPWYGFRDMIVSVHIDGITTLGAFAFYKCQNLRTVHLWEGKLLDSVLSIGDHAFGDGVQALYFGSPIWRIWTGKDCFGQEITPVFRVLRSELAPVTSIVVA